MECDMTAKHFRWPFIGVLAAFVVAINVAEFTTLGLSAEWSSRSGYRLSGGTQPWALAFAVVVNGLYLLLMFTEPVTPGQPLPGVFRRFIAFWLDFVLAMAAVGPILGLLPTFTEWRRTGIFQWSFERTTSVPGDDLLLWTEGSLSVLAVVLYYALPLVRRRPSPGTCIAGYQIVPDDGFTPTLRIALLRTLLGFIALSTAYLAPFIARDRTKGKFWLDKVFRTRAVMLT
jgi:uncharacterized RDD family membrane protein YckC